MLPNNTRDLVSESDNIVSCHHSCRKFPSQNSLSRVLDVANLAERLAEAAACQRESESCENPDIPITKISEATDIIFHPGVIPGTEIGFSQNLDERNSAADPKVSNTGPTTTAVRHQATVPISAPDNCSRTGPKCNEKLGGIDENMFLAVSIVLTFF